MLKYRILLALLFSSVFLLPSSASDWVEDDAPASSGDPSQPDPGQSLYPGPPSLPDSGQSGYPDPPSIPAIPTPNPFPPKQSPKQKKNWLLNPITTGAKNAVAVPGKLATGSKHLVQDPRFWTVTAGAAALGAAGVGTYFLIKNASNANYGSGRYTSMDGLPFATSVPYRSYSSRYSNLDDDTTWSPYSSSYSNYSSYPLSRNYTARNIGNFGYIYGPDGTTTVNRIGDYTYLNGPSGTTTVNRIGNFTYLNGPSGRTTANTIGNFTYLNGPSGRTTINRIGDYDYVSGPNGFSGTINRIGDTYYGNFNSR